MASETLLSIINKLGLSEIVEEWVKQTWQADFTDIDSLPEEIETTLVQNAYYRQQWKLLGDELDTWTSSESQETSLWTTLVENDVGHKRLIAFIFYITEVGSKRLASSDQRLAAIQASNVYYKLILIPGSGAFQIFHPFLFEKVVDVMKEWCHSHQAVNISSSQKRKSSPKRSSKSSKRGRGSRAGRDIDSEDEDFGEDDDDDAAEHQFTAAENKAITKAIMDLIRTFVSLLRSYSLQDSEHSLSVTYELLADLTKIEPETYSPQRFQGDGNLRNVLSFPQLAYMGLYAVASNRHGEIHRMYNSTMKNLLSGILMFVGPNNAIATPNIPRSIKNIKDHSIHFVKTLLTQNLDNAVISARTLIQHMSTKVPDKTEYKTNVAQAIVMILKDFSVYEYSRMLLWFQKLSKAEKIPWRGFSVEVVSLLLHEPLREADDLVTDELLNCLTHNFLLQIILSRCNDVSPTVRARAIHLFSDCASSPQDLVQQALREIITPMSSTRLPRSRYEATPKKTIGDTPSESSSACCTIGNSKLSSGVVNSENSVENSQTAEQTGDNSNNVPGNTDKSATENSSNAKTNESTNTEMSTVNNTGRTSTSTVNSTDNRTGDRTMGRTMFVPAGSEISLADNSGVISMLRHRAQDDKVYVRKSSVSAMEVLIKANPDCITQQNMEIFEARCLDVSLSVRKQALISITELLLHHPTSVLIHKCWLNRVPYLIKDRENSVQEKCLEVLESVILDNITTYERSVDEQHQLLWSLLQIVSGVEGTTHRLYLSEAFRLWSKTGKIKPFLTKALQSHLVTENKKSAWTLLFLMAPFIPKMDTTFIIDYWKDNAQELVNDTEDETFHSVLQVISYMAKLLKPDDQRFFSQNLLKLVMKFCCSPKIISSLVTAIDLLETALNKDNENTSSWCNPVMSACDKYLSNAILNENQDVSINEDEMMGYIYTLGDVAQLIPNRIPRRVFLLIQSIIAAPQITPNDGVTQKPASQESEGNDDDPENVSPSQEVPASQGVPYSQGITGSQPILSQFSGSKMSVRIRAYAFITLGKLCLQHDDIAKKCIPALGRELETSRDAPVRNNVVIALCDLFKIHTTYVERYTNSISACLRDPVPLIRYQTLIMITELLQEDYMKWKGPLFYRYIIALLDDHKVITNFIQYCLVHLVLIRHPAMFFHHFVEALFYFNGYEGHSMYNHFDQTEKEKQLFCLNGQQNSSKRMTLYTFLLQNLSDEYKFQVSAKLCQEILGGFVDNVIPLNSETSSLLQDALQILYSKEIKLTTLKSKSNDDVVEEQDMEQAVINAAKKQIITKVVKKDVIENIVPVVIALKHLLEKEHSVVLKSLMLYLRELMKDYKDEVKDILSADRQLANEIEFDLKKFERDEEERNEQSTVNRINSPQKDANRHTPGKNLQTPARTRNPPTVTTPGRGLATPARVLTTPARGLATPGRLVGTPFKTPLKAMQTPQQMPRTPRNLPMSTQVIMNSARKAMEHRVSHVPSGLLTPRQSSITAGSLTELRKQKKVVVWADKENNTDTFDDDSRKSTNLSGGTQSERKHNERRRILSRAISTPHRGLSLGNITFQQLDTDISAIVPSPINSRDSSDWVHDDLSTDKDRRSDKQPVKHVLHMPSPDQPAPKPRRWNLKARNSKSLDGATKRLSLQSMDNDTNTVSNLTDTTRQKESAAAKPTTKETNPRRSSSRTRKSTAETPNVDVEMPKTPADTQDIHADTPRRSSRHNTSVTSAKPNSPKVARRKSIRNK